MDKLDAATWLVPTQEMMNSGWDVTLMVSGDPRQTHVGNVAVHHISTPDIFLLRQVVFHTKVIKSLCRWLDLIDVLLFHEASSPWFLFLAVCNKIIGKKRPLFVMDTRSLPMTPEDKATWRDKIRGEVILQMNKFSNYFFDGRTAITKRMAESLQIPDDKLWGVWPSGVKLENFADALQMRKWPNPGEPIKLLYIGCMHHERNLLTLSQAVTKANAEQHRFTLTIVGDGNARKELEQYAREEGRHVHIVPPVPHEEIPKWLAGAHVGVLPFPDEEKFRVSSPIKLFEYLAAGLPILATKIACHTDVVGDHPVAFWAKSSDIEGLFDALLLLYENCKTLPKMGEKAALIAHDWTWESSANKLKEALVYGFQKG
jgi:glycosyltransferase involved in cell wall biosynthesis